MIMQGKKVTVDGPHLLKEGEYMKWESDWYAFCPGPNRLVANLSAHSVVESADGTITVSPSILCCDGRVSWHGYLENGIWKKV